MNTDDLRTILVILKRLYVNVSKEELAVAHVACPALYEQYKRLVDEINNLESELNYREDREYDRRIDAEEARREYERYPNAY